MPSIKDLRRRLRSVQSTKLITRAMRSVSASKMRRCQDQRHKAKPYADHLQALVNRLVANTGLENQPLAEIRPVEKRLVVMFASDRGLCGSFNHSINRYAEHYLESTYDTLPDMYAIGKRAADYFKKRNINIVASRTDFRGNIDTPKILEVAAEIRDWFLEGRYDEIELILNYPLSAISYKPRHDILLPLKKDEMVAESDEFKRFQIDYIFEPDAHTVLTGLLPKYVENKVLFALIDSLTAEHQARMMAMTTANENCIELIDDVTLKMNKARQTQITKEILEIVSGAEALKG